MITPDEFTARRDRLADSMSGDGVVLMLGHDHAPMNFAANPYPFRQDTTFRYFFGLEEPGAVGWIDFNTGEQRLYGHEADLDTMIWEGEQPPLADRSAGFGSLDRRPIAELADDLDHRGGRRVHTIPPTRAEQRDRLSHLLGPTEPSPELVAAVVALRERKSQAEISEISEAVGRSGLTHRIAMRSTNPGMSEGQVMSVIEAVAAGHGWAFSYPTIFSVRGEVLHNPHHSNDMLQGQMVVHDGGINSSDGYAADITRSFPVDGTFTPAQRAVYEVVLAAQGDALDMIAPGVPYRSVHDAACLTIAEGLTAMGLMRGDPADAVAAGAHAVFFPHGVGHMLGLDVHDMEAIGEDAVGYDDHHRRSAEFGTANLRLGKPLADGFVVTVEPGVYFIGPLLDRWRSNGTASAFIDFAAVDRFRGFGGVRIEDVVHVTAGGAEVLGNPIPKTIEEVEATCAGEG